MNLLHFRLTLICTFHSGDAPENVTGQKLFCRRSLPAWVEQRDSKWVSLCVELSGRPSPIDDQRNHPEKDVMGLGIKVSLFCPSQQSDVHRYIYIICIVCTCVYSTHTDRCIESVRSCSTCYYLVGSPSLYEVYLNVIDNLGEQFPYPAFINGHLMYSNGNVKKP